MGSANVKQKPTVIQVTRDDRIKKLIYNSTDFPLAKPRFDHLPDVVRTAGFSAIDKLAQAVLSAFENDGRGVELQGAETARLQAFIGLPKTVADSLGPGEFADVAAFVTEVVRCIKLNTVLVGAAAVWWESSGRGCTIRLSIQEKAELRLSVYWCFLMHIVCKKTTFQPKPRDNEECYMEQIATAFEKKRNELQWKKNKKQFNAFSKMKVWGVDKAFYKQLALKKGQRDVDGKAGEGLLLSVNILMAMFSDVKKGNYANAEAAFELMAESNDQKTLKGLNNKIDYEFKPDGVPSGVQAYAPPLPTVWANLYGSWNLAFVCGHKPSAPMLCAKLLAPVVLGTYQDVAPGLYLSPRVLCLYMMLQYNIVALSAASDYQVVMPNGESRNFSDWRIKMREATALLGGITEVAAKQYHARIDKIILDNHGAGVKNLRNMQRSCASSGWILIKDIVKTVSQAKKHKSESANADVEHTPVAESTDGDDGVTEEDAVMTMTDLE